MTDWEKCVAFHGHECGGLTIGYKAALLAIKKLNIKFSEDEEIVCVAENDACGIDAIQVLLGCSVGKGNLLFHMRGKQAFSFYNRSTNESIRLVLKDRPEGMTREEFNRELKTYEGQLRYWRVMQNRRVESDLILGYYYDKKSRTWKMYVTDDRGELFIYDTFETEEKALDGLMVKIRLEAERTQRLKEIYEKAAREAEQAKKENS